MNRFLLQLAYLPVTIFMASVDLLDRVLGKGRGANGSNSLPAGSGPNSTTSGGIVEVDPSKKENPMRDDHDLSGDEVKLVSYSILFTKRDLEATLQNEQEQLVNYDTDGASFGALKLAEFTATKRFHLPQVWKGSGYPRPWAESLNETLLTVADIPDDDRKYIRFIFRVKERLSKNTTEYEKRQTRALEGIEFALKGR